MRLSEHFDSSEFMCNCIGEWTDNLETHRGCGGIALADSRLVEAFEQLRNIVEAPIIITSGFRCKIWNSFVGGSKTSKHMTGEAGDPLCPSHLTVDEFAEAAEKVEAFRNGGIGKYSNPDRLHLDVRTDGPKRWDKR